MQAWMTSYLADTSGTSVYADTPSADFFRKLAHNQPHLIDWLLEVRACVCVRVCVHHAPCTS